MYIDSNIHKWLKETICVPELDESLNRIPNY